MLAPVTEVHPRPFAVPKPSPVVAPAHTEAGDEHPFGRFLQLEVQGGPIGRHQALQSFDGLMVLQYLHRGDMLRGDVLGGDAVTTLEQVHPLDGQVYRLALVGYLPVLPHPDARQLLQHVLNDPVVLRPYRFHMVHNRVPAFEPHLGRLHLHLPQLEGLPLHAEVLPPVPVGHPPGQARYPKPRHAEIHAVERCHEFQAVVARPVRTHVAHRQVRLPRRPGQHVGRHALPVPDLRHPPLDHRLRNGTPGPACKDKEKPYP